MNRAHSLLCSFLAIFVWPAASYAVMTTCAPDDTNLGRIEVGVLYDANLYEGPSENYRKVINRKASEALGTIHFHQIDTSTTVEAICQRGEFAYVKIKTPSWMKHVEGWAKADSLRSIKRDSSGNRIYVEEDFHWDKHTKKYKKDIVNAMNFLVDSGMYVDIDPQSLSRSLSKSSAARDVFFITCGKYPKAKNIFFDLKQIKEWSAEYQKSK